MSLCPTVFPLPSNPRKRLKSVWPWKLLLLKISPTKTSLEASFLIELTNLFLFKRSSLVSKTKLLRQKVLLRRTRSFSHYSISINWFSLDALSRTFHLLDISSYQLIPKLSLYVLQCSIFLIVYIKLAKNCSRYVWNNV